MPSWKKMAEAFGRAVTRAGDTPTAKMVNDAGWKSDNWYEFSRGKGDSFNPNVPEKDFKNFQNRRSRQALQADFNKEFDDAVNKASTDEAAIRENAIEMLKAGKSIPDVLDMLKGR